VTVFVPEKKDLGFVEIISISPKLGDYLDVSIADHFCCNTRFNVNANEGGVKN
jgi:hypothetical protein